MTKMDYKEAYLALKAGTLGDKTALSDLVRCIDKMVMLGGKMTNLDTEIRAAIWSKKYEAEMPEFEVWCRDELEALTYMASSLTGRVEHHKLINRCKEKGDPGICDFIKDFERVTLMVKSREIGVRETMLKLVRFRHLTSEVTMVG